MPSPQTRYIRCCSSPAQKAGISILHMFSGMEIPERDHESLLTSGAQHIQVTSAAIPVSIELYPAAFGASYRPRVRIRDILRRQFKLSPVILRYHPVRVSLSCRSAVHQGLITSSLPSRLKRSSSTYLSIGSLSKRPSLSSRILITENDTFIIEAISAIFALVSASMVRSPY